ncbi:MAG: TonB family protein [bacterium]
MNLFKGFIISILIHAALLGAGFWTVKVLNARTMSIDIDMRASSLLLRAKNSIGSRRKNTLEPWVLAVMKKADPRPVTQTVIPDEVKVDGPDNDKDFAYVAASAQRPEWLEGFITDADYPQNARARGKQGRVKAEVFLLASGEIKEVVIMNATDPLFAKAVEDKLRKAKFRPALDSDGVPMNVRMIIPVSFKLQ